MYEGRENNRIRIAALLGLFLLAAVLTGGCRTGGNRALRAKFTGKPAPGFALKDLDGETVRLDDLRGKPVLLALFAYG